MSHEQRTRLQFRNWLWRPEPGTCWPMFVDQNKSNTKKNFCQQISPSNIWNDITVVKRRMIPKAMQIVFHTLSIFAMHTYFSRIILFSTQFLFGSRCLRVCVCEFFFCITFRCFMAIVDFSFVYVEYTAKNKTRHLQLIWFAECLRLRQIKRKTELYTNKNVSILCGVYTKWKKWRAFLDWIHQPSQNRMGAAQEFRDKLNVCEMTSPNYCSPASVPIVGHKYAIFS